MHPHPGKRPADGESERPHATPLPPPGPGPAGRSTPAPVRLTAARLAVPLAAGVAVWSLAAAERDPAAAAEGRYLALLAAAALLPAGALAPAPARELGLGAVLAAAAAWALPPGPTRGTAVVAVLAATLAIAALRCLSRRTGAGLPFAVTLPLALGLQVLLRGDLLLAPSPRALAVLVGLPVAGAAAVAWLARRRGAGVALIAAASALLLGPGWNVAATATLAALAAGDLLADPPAALRGRWRWIARGAALAVLLAPLAWQQRAGLLIALAGLTLWRPTLGAAGALVAALAASLLPLPPGEASLFPWYVWLPLLLPGLALPDPARWHELLTGVLLASAARAVAGEAALAPAVALAALALRRESAPAAFQAVWTGALLGGTALLAAYPWLREQPVADLVELLGPAPLIAAGTVVLAGLLGAAYQGIGGRRLSHLRPATAAVLALTAFAGLLMVLRLPPAERALLGPEQSVVIDAARPGRDLPLGGQGLAGLIVTSSLLNASGLAAGTTVATVRLQDGAGEVAWPLRVGIETGEWAARRPDVRAAGAVAPPAWACFVADGFFGQRYRGRLTLPAPRSFTRIAIEREPGLPPQIALVLHEVRLVEAGR